MRNASRRWTYTHKLMKTQFSRFWRARTLLIVAFLVPAAAHAQYLDPGASSIIVQSIVAGVVAVAAVVKVFWWKISGIFSSNKSRDN